VLKVTSKDRVNLDVIGKSRNARAQSTHSTNQNLNRNASLRCSVKLVDDLLINQRVHLEADTTCLACLLVGNLSANAFG
jgi:hypothetical protein